MSIELVIPSNHLILCSPPLLPPSIFPSIRVFSNESVLRIRWPEYWSFSFSISPSNGYSGLISFRMDWLDLLAVQGVYVDLKAPDAGKDWRKEEKGTTDDETVGLHHQLDEHEFEQAPGVGDGQGSLACYSPWDSKDSDMLSVSWTELNVLLLVFPKKQFPSPA